MDLEFWFFVILAMSLILNIVLIIVALGQRTRITNLEDDLDISESHADER